MHKPFPYVLFGLKRDNSCQFTLVHVMQSNDIFFPRYEVGGCVPERSQSLEMYLCSQKLNAVSIKKVRSSFITILLQLLLRYKLALNCKSLFMKFLDFLSFENGSNNAENDGVHSSVMEALLFTSYGGGGSWRKSLLLLRIPLFTQKIFYQSPYFTQVLRKYRRSEIFRHVTTRPKLFALLLPKI